MNPAATGLSFVNPLEQSYSDLNQNLVGSGVALWDVNGDHLCDIFFASLNGTCRLFVNQGGWTFEGQTIQGGLVIKNQLTTGALLEDLDGYGDLFVAQDWESTPDLIGRLDAGQGLILQGKPDGCFEALSSEASGICIDAEQQGAWVGDANGDQRPGLWIQHSVAIQLYLNQHER